MPAKNKGLSMVIGVLILFIIIIGVALSQLIALQRYDDSSIKAISIEEERRQERIYIVGLTNETIDDTTYIDQITVKNTGSITVLIKSLYIDHDFLFDPSDELINPNGGRINPNSTLSISLKGLTPRELYNPKSLVTVATERGTRSIAYEDLLSTGKKTIVTVQSNFGPLKLHWDVFEYASYSGGTTGPPMPGWLVSTKEGQVVWRIEVENIDTKDITLNKTSCFVLMSITQPSAAKSWYIDITSPLTIPHGGTAQITFKASTPEGGDPNTPFGTECSCKVFLSFFGSFQPENTPYAQTIPFESVDIYRS